jgi:hypothetical protein
MVRIMKKDELDTLMKQAICLKQKKRSKSSCPSEETVADYLNRKLRGKAVDKVERHLLVCDACLEQAMISSKLLREENLRAETVSSSVLERAIGLFALEKKGSILEEGRKFWVEIIEKGKEVAQVFYPKPLAPVFVRGQQEKGGENIISFNRTFERVILGIEVEKVARRTVQMKVRVNDSINLKAMNQVRVTLQEEDKEVASYLTENGRTSFDSLPFGMYGINIQQGSVILAKLLINIKGNSHA